MDSKSNVAQKVGSKIPGNAETPPLSFDNRTTELTEASAIAGATFPPLMLQQMKSIIEGAIEGAVDKRLTALGMNPKAIDTHNDIHEGGGSKSTPGIEKQKLALKNPKVVKDLSAKLPQYKMMVLAPIGSQQVRKILMNNRTFQKMIAHKL